MASLAQRTQIVGRLLAPFSTSPPIWLPSRHTTRPSPCAANTRSTIGRKRSFSCTGDDMCGDCGGRCLGPKFFPGLHHAPASPVLLSFALLVIKTYTFRTPTHTLIGCTFFEGCRATRVSAEAGLSCAQRPPSKPEPPYPPRKPLRKLAPPTPLHNPQAKHHTKKRWSPLSVILQTQLPGRQNSCA